MGRGGQGGRGPRRIVLTAIAPLLLVLVTLIGCGSRGGSTTESNAGAEAHSAATGDGAARSSQTVLECGLITGDGDDELSAARATPDGGVILAGAVEGRADLDPGSSEELRGDAESGRRAFVISVDAEGALRWARELGGPNITISSIDVTSQGEVLAVGTFQGDIDLGGGVRLDGDRCRAGWDLFAFKLDARGEPTWARAITAPSWVSGESVVVADDGSVRLAGTFEGRVDLDPGEGEDWREPADKRGVFVVALDQSGSYRWATTWSGEWLGSALDLVAGPSGTAVLLGSFQETLNVDPGEGEDIRSSQGSYDLFLIKLDGEGRSVWSKTLGGTGFERPRALAARPDGSVVIAGDFEETIDLDPSDGVAEQRVESGRSSFLASLDQEGRFQWGSVQPEIAGLAVRPDGAIVVGGRAGGSLTLRSLTPSGEQSASIELEAGQPTAIRAVASPSRDRAVMAGTLSAPIGGEVGSRDVQCRPSNGVDLFLFDLELNSGLAQE